MEGTRTLTDDLSFNPLRPRTVLAKFGFLGGTSASMLF
jgi:hypothetical protein